MKRLPVIFFGHGNPLNAILDNDYARRWAAIGREIPRPRAVLAISAHWYIEGSAVTEMESPRTIHDFGGFPKELYAVEYPAPGSPSLAERVRELLSPLPVAPDRHWGLDHGTWSVLCRVFPAADIPVVQLSMDRRQTAEVHYQIGQRLAPLRDEGILIIGSGNVVHNLGAYAWADPHIEAFDWTRRFEANVRAAITAHQHQPLIDWEQFGQDARLSIPTPEHYLPLLYILGASSAASENDRIEFPVEGIEGGSISMLTVMFTTS